MQIKIYKQFKVNISSMLIACVFVLSGLSSVFSQSLTGFGVANQYVQDFNTFAGTNATVPTGWTVSPSPTGGFYNRGTYSNGNALYALRESASPGTDRAIGGKLAANSGNCSSSGTATFSLNLTNSTGFPIEELNVSWNAEQYSRGGRAATLDFSYSMDNGSTFITSNITGTTLFTSVTGSDGALASIATTSFSININNINILNNGNIILRYRLCTGAGGGNNGHVGLDDVIVYAVQQAPANAAPTASNVDFTGNLTVGSLLTGTYDYADAENDLEGTSTYRWFRADDNAGLNEDPISGATSTTYSLGGGDLGKFIRYGVVPIAATGTTTGTETFSAWYGPVTSGLAATNLVLSSIVPANPTAGVAFSVTVESRDDINAVAPVQANTEITLSTNGAAGTIGGTITGTILAGESMVTINNVTLATPGSNANITATRTSGDNLTAGISADFDVLAPYSLLAFVGFPANGAAGSPISTFTVEARRPDNSVDINFNDEIEISIETGTGSISGTTTVFAVNGVATFSNVIFSTSGDFTLRADDIQFNTVSGTISISLSNSDVVEWVNTGNATAWYTNTNWNPTKTSGQWLSSEVARFNNEGNATSSGINLGTSSLSIAAIEISNLRTRSLMIGSSSSNGDLTLNGGVVNGIPNIVLSNKSNFDFIIQNNQSGSGKSMDIVLANSTENVVEITGSGNIEISSLIEGTNRNLTKIGTGSGVLILSGANTYTGTTTISEGTLQLNRTGGNTLPSTNNVNITGGTLQVSTNQTLANLELSSGNLIVDNGVTLTLTNFTYTAGTISGAGNIVYAANSTLTFEGNLTTTDQTWPSVNGPANFEVIAPAVVNLHANRNIEDIFIVNTGAEFHTGSNTLSFGENALFLEDGLVTGNLEAESIVNNTTGGFAGIGLTINSAENMGLVVVTRRNGPSIDPQIGNDPNNKGYNRLFEVEVIGTNTNLNATVELTVGFNDLNGNTFATSSIYKRPIGATNPNVYEEIIPLRDPITNTFIFTVDEFSELLPGPENAPLNITLGDFSAENVSETAVLSWTTVSETNSEKFVIERADKNFNWISLGSLAASGNSATPIAYQFIDNAPKAGTNYYRLKLISASETVYSATRVLNFNNKVATVSPRFFPNPSNGNLVISLGDELEVNINIYDLQGKLVFSSNLQQNGNIDLSALKAGIYHIKMNGANQSVNERLVIIQ